jgi:transcriptional regulator with XRE-family HTH domain
MKRSEETFRATPELGERLRLLRLQAGITQQELAVLMGRQGKGNHRLVGMLELGKVPYPSLGFVADYLRACRASFVDIADLLEAYTSKPTVLEERGYKRVRSLAGKLPPEVWNAVRRYDDKVTRSRRKPEPEGRRLGRAEAYARSQDAQRRLDEVVADELSKAGIDSASVIAFRLRLYARKLWGVLNKTRKAKPQKLERKLKHKLKVLDRWAADAGLSSLPVLSALSARITELESAGEPDRPPSARD